MFYADKAIHGRILGPSRNGGGGIGELFVRTEPLRTSDETGAVLTYADKAIHGLCPLRSAEVNAPVEGPAGVSLADGHRFRRCTSVAPN